MARTPFYFGTIKKIIATFGTLFNDVRFTNTHNVEIKVPLHYSPKEKFVDEIQQNNDLDESNFDTVLPRMGFEISSLNMAPERHLNPLSKFDDTRISGEDERYMFNRIPYDINFSLYIGTRYFEDSLKITEQILPFFTPELTVTIHDKDDFDLNTNVTFVLNSCGFDIDYEGTFDTRRKIIWTLGFTAKAYLYSNVREQARIKQTIIELHNQDFDDIFERLTSTVNPRSATESEAHTIDQVLEEVATNG